MEPRGPTCYLFLSILSIGAHRQLPLHICEVKKVAWNFLLS